MFAELNPTAIALIFTYMEMTERPVLAAEQPDYPLRLERLERPSRADYLALFRLVGEPWLWCERLLETEAGLDAILKDPSHQVYAVRDERDAPVGMLDLEFGRPGEAKIAYLGLLPDLTGQGHGRWLIGEALRLAWRPDVDSLHLVTNSIDHPAAIRSYLRAGFRPFARAIGTRKDPRLEGLYPLSAAPHVPIITHPRRL